MASSNGVGVDTIGAELFEKTFDQPIDTGDAGVLNENINDDQGDAFGSTQPTYGEIYAAMPVERDAIYYNMNHKKRGLALIFNHEIFEVAGLKPRAGTNEDCNNLKRSLSKLNFNVQVYKDLKYLAIEEHIKQVSKMDHSEHDCIVVSILSHGEQGIIYAKDTHYKPDSLWSSFTPDKCPSLAGKPKLFFIQACQGDKLDPGVKMFTRTETDGDVVASYRIPLQADFLVMYSTVKVLSLFTLVQFDREECIGPTGNRGTCLSAMECSQRGGSGDGICAAGYGTCCVFLQSCGTFVRENRTLFVNNNYPEPYDGIGTCQITLLKVSPDICQYRMDFDDFVLMGPETQNHICENDQFIIAGAQGSVPIICGMNSGNHIYLDAGSDPQNSMVLSIVTNGASFNRTWKIRISQIPCSSNYKADEGCLQYFSSVSGQITSFNYNSTTGLQLSNQNYGICIRQDRNFCGVQYTQCPDPDNRPVQSFTLSGNSNNNVPAMVGSTGGSNYCQADYLIIPMVSNVGRPPSGPIASVDRICGGILSADVTLNPTTVRSGVKPFRLWFHTDGVEAPTDRSNKGFCLNYIQQPCTNSI